MLDAKFVTEERSTTASGIIQDDMSNDISKLCMGGVSKFSYFNVFHNIGISPFVFFILAVIS